jgi:S1-C subfamily serine protease
MKKPFAVAAAVSCIMAAGCSSESAPASTPLEVPAGVSTSPSESYPDRIEIPNGILDLSSLAVRQAFGGLPAAVSAHKQGLVLVLDKSNIVHLGNGATQYDRSLGTGFKADASHMVTAGHVIAGADRSEVNCGDTDIYTPPLTGGNNTFQAHLTEAAGSYAPDYSTPDLGIATVESSDSNFTALPSIPLRPTNTPIAPGTKFSDGVAAGVVSAENTLPTDEFSQRFGYRVIGATAVSYTIMEAVSRADVDSLSAQAHACVPTP